MHKLAIFFLTAFFLFANEPVNSQDNRNINAFWNDANGQPLRFSNTIRSEGSPYYYDEYAAADIIMVNGNKYENIKIKFNLETNDVIYFTSGSQEMVAVSAISKIRFLPCVINDKANEEKVLISSDRAINTKGSAIYEIVVDSPARLLKKIDVSFKDTRPYGEASIIRVYKNSQTLFASFPAKSPQAVRLPKNNDEVVALFPDKSKEIKKFIETHNLKCRSDKDVAKVFEYYNSLK